MRFALLAILFSSCSNDDNGNQIDTPPVVETIGIFMPMAVGNYWVYDVYKIDDQGNEELRPNQDRIEVVGETIINNEIYYIVNDGVFGLYDKTSNLRDSLSYIIDSDGLVRFSSTNFNNILYSYEAGSFNISFSMDEEVRKETVPAGEFDCLNYEGLVTDSNPTFMYPDRTLNNYYAKNVGLVKSTVFLLSSITFYYERRLVEFNVQ